MQGDYWKVVSFMEIKPTLKYTREVRITLIKFDKLLVIKQQVKLCSLYAYIGMTMYLAYCGLTTVQGYCHAEM